MSAALRLLRPEAEQLPPQPPKRATGFRLPNFLREEEVNRIFAECLNQQSNATCSSRLRAAKRDHVILSLGFFMGLRLSEIADLDTAHLDFHRRELFVFQGKNSKDRSLPIPAKCLDLFQGHAAAGPFIARDDGRRMSIATIAHRVRRLARLANIGKRTTPHTMRHTFAVRLIERGVPLHEIRDLMGHSSIAVTNVYLHCVPERLRAAIDLL